MELTKEKYEELVKLIQSHDESIKNLKAKIKVNESHIEELQTILATSIHIIMMDNASLASILLAILETASKDKSLDITDIKQTFILNMSQNKKMMQDFAESEDIDEAIDQYTAFFEMLETEQKVADKIKPKKIKTSGNTTKKVMDKDYNDSLKSKSSNKKSANNTVNIDKKKVSNIIHFDFKGDKK